MLVICYAITLHNLHWISKHIDDVIKSKLRGKNVCCSIQSIWKLVNDVDIDTEYL